jgi:hypothetical protein
LITYEDATGVGSTFPGQFKRVKTWREVDGTTSVTRNFTANYNATTGRLTTVTVA